MNARWLLLHQRDDSLGGDVEKPPLPPRLDAAVDVADVRKKGLALSGVVVESAGQEQEPACFWATLSYDHNRAPANWQG